MTSVYPIVFVVMSIVSCWLAWRHAHSSVRTPLAVFCGMYLATTVIGATVVGLWGPDVLEALNYDLDVSLLQGTDGALYWGILFAPLIVVPVVAALPGARGVAASPLNFLQRIGDDPSLPALSIALVVLGGGCMVWVVGAGFAGNLLAWITYRGDNTSLVNLREAMASRLGGVFFGLVYIGLPTLCLCAMYRFVRRPGWWVGVLLACSVLVTALLCVWVVQKSPLVVLLLSLAVGLKELKVIRLRTAAPAALVGTVLVVGLLQSFFVESWGLSGTAKLMVFRMATSYPFYINLYPDYLPHFGMDLGLHVAGLAPSPQDNLDVFYLMYPGVTWAQGAASAAAHVRGYAQAGVFGALVTLAGIGVLVLVAAAVRRCIHGPCTFALYIQSLVLLYYTTQTSLQESLLSSYGVIWAILALVLVAVFDALMGATAPNAAAS